MSIRPFSNHEIDNLKIVCEKNGWRITQNIENYFRYSLKKDKLIIFTIKFPVSLPVRLNIPLEIVSFRISIAFKLWDLNQNTTKVILYFMKMLRDLALQVSLDHNFPINGKEEQLVNILNILLPEPINNENESTWLNRIRVSLMNKRDELQQDNTQITERILKILSSIRLNPTFKLPWELKAGVPKIRTAETLFFSNEEIFDEFFILEKGYFTYFKDLEYNKIYIRSQFDSYTPYVLTNLFTDTEFNLELYLENWVKFSRMMLNSVLEIINLASINQNELIQFHAERELQQDGFEQDQNNFPFSALHYESNLTKSELYQIHNDLFNNPPTNFEVMESINSYTDAEELIKRYRFDDATELLNESLKIFNKNKQKKVVCSILLKLHKIASLINQDGIALNYLVSALGVTKSGEVPIDYIIKIHYKLGKWFFQTNQFVESIKQFDIIISFLEKETLDEEASLNEDDYLGLAYIYKGLINSELSKLADAKLNFKKAFHIASKSTKVKLKYHLLRAKYYKNKGNLSQAQKLLRAAIDSVGIDFDDRRYEHIFLDLILELAEFYIHHRIDSKKALYLLKNIEHKVSLNLKEISGIKRSIRWDLLMSDYYDIIAKDSNNSAYYYKQSQILSNQLKKIGVLK